MPHSIIFPVRRALAVLLLAAPGCGSDLVLPEPSNSGEVASKVAMLGGDAQQGPVGETLGQQLKVQVLTRSDAPVEGVQVTFELTDPNGGSLSPAAATTNGAGEAVASWELGTVPGSYTAVARIVSSDSADPVEFHATAHAAAPDTLTALPPQDQPGIRQAAVREPPRVRVVDRFGNPVPDIPVAWQVIAGEGQVGSAITTTDAGGMATVEWVLGNRMGVHKLTATVQQSSTGSPAVFEARVLF